MTSEKRGQFVFYRQTAENLVNTLHSFIQEACPVSRPFKREGAALAERAESTTEAGS